MATSRTYKPRKKPVQRRSQFMVAQILEGAARVFAERGYANTTTNHIAQCAGVSVGSLYQYFPNKDAILVELQRTHSQEVAAALNQVIDAVMGTNHPLEQLIRRFVTTVFELHAAQPKLHHVLLHEAPRSAEASDALHDMERAMGAALCRLLESYQEVSDSHARHAAFLVIHVVENLAHELVVHPPQDINRAELVEEVVVMLVGYLRQGCSRDGESRPRPEQSHQS